jgi:DNA-binding transcriptional MerR regulator
MSEQVGNAVEAPESNSVQDSVMSMGSDDFFESLDAQVNGAILDEPSQPTSTQSDNTQASPNVEVQEQVSEVDTLQKRYSDSSREAKRLNGKLSELEPYMPILDAMREDPNLIAHVRNYFEGGGQTPQTMTDKLNLDEDFMFDADDAFQKPESDSAKVLGATIDGVVQRRLNSALQGQKVENEKLARETDFRSRHNMNDEEWSQFVDFAKSKSLALDDIYYLMNRNNRDEKIADNTRQEIHEKMREVQQQPGTLATQGSVQTEQSPDDSVFDAILGQTNELEEAFGI